jgi:hypothetical protein
MSYRRTYRDLHVEGEEGYSFAEHAADLGHIVVALHNIGVGASSPPIGGGDVGFAELGRAIVDASKSIATDLAGGTLAPGLDPVPDARLVGLGHSMGAGAALAAQALSAPWVAIPPVGFPTNGTPSLYDTAPPEAISTRDKAREWVRANIPQTILGRRWEEIDPYFMIDRPSFRSVLRARSARGGHRRRPRPGDDRPAPGMAGGGLAARHRGIRAGDPYAGVPLLRVGRPLARPARRACWVRVQQRHNRPPTDGHRALP